MRNVWITLTLVTAFAATGCSSKKETKEEAVDTTANVSTPMQPQSFGTLSDGREVKSYTLKNKNGVEMKVINYGGIITHLRTPDKSGVLEDIVLGYDSLDGYLKATPYFGAIVGRYGNRIANGKFKVDGKEYSVAQNNNGQHLHGGEKGFDKVFWDVEPYTSPEGEALKLTYLSKDMEEGYPGNLTVKVDYVLTDANELKISYEATTDKKTVINLTQHTYFNLTGGKRDILDHELVIKSDKLVPVNKVLIPTGKLTDVKGTPFDFNEPVKVGARINEKDNQLTVGGGYDHCWVLSTTDSMKMAATLYEATTGRFVEVFTSEPGIQFYSGNFLDGTIVGKNGITYAHRFGLCLETEHFPDSPNQPAFPSVLLAPGETYKTQTVYKFSAK